MLSPSSPRILPARAILLTLTSWLSLPAQTISISPERANGLYLTGETIRWQITVSNAAQLTSPTYTIKSGGLNQTASGALTLTNGQATLTTTLAQPGWVLLEVDGTSATNTKLQAFGGAVAGADNIAPAAPRPDDFDSFWNAKLQDLATVPINPVLTNGPSGRTGVDYSTVTLDCVRNTHVQGQLARPTSGSSLPALLIVQWAGVYSLQKSWVTDRAAEGWLVLNIQAHDIPPIESDAYYQALTNGALNNYWHIGNDDRETSYYLRMYLACHRAAEYLTTRSDWNGRTLVVMGASQGGMQSLVTAGLHPKVTAALAEVPAGCDQGGLDAGRLPGWPVWAYQAWDRDLSKVMQTSRYYDATNFAARITCPVLMGVGLIDTTVPPPGVYATCNLLTGAKQIVTMPLADHSNNHTPYYASQTAWLSDARTAKMPTIGAAPQSVSVAVGNTASFSVAASNGQAYGYQWLRNGSPIARANQGTFSITNVSATDQAQYAVIVTSPGGSVTSSAATLTVEEGPAITTQPVATTAEIVGGTTTLTVVANGIPTPTFQWRKNTVAISGATNAALTLDNVQTADAGTYSVVATNTLGSATSADAVLTVWPVRPSTFNAQEFLNRYSDLQTLYGTLPDKLDQAWIYYLSTGLNNGRNDGDFDVTAYLTQYPSVQSMFGSDLPGAALYWYDIGRQLGQRIPAGFDVSAYLARYPLVAAAYGTDLYGAWLHYRDHGLYNGEIYDDLFRVEEYLTLYPELFALFGSDLSAALMHWLTEGRIEGKLGRIPSEFSADGYFTRNLDVATAVNNDALLAWSHYWLYGIYEGRAYDDELRAFEYLAINADLTAAFVNDWREATLHWMRYGRTEGRLGRLPLIFNVTEYLNRNPDVAPSWGTNPTTVFLHFWMYGINEGRTFDDLFRVDDYLALNPDLAAIFGTNRPGAFKHWVRYGQAEGRQGKYP